VEYVPGEDELWDRLGGDDWGAIDGVVEGVRVYATWGEDSNTRLVVTGLMVSGSPKRPVTADVLRAIPIGRLEASANEARLASASRALERPEVKLSRPDGRNPDAFYEAVAAHYRWHAAVSPKPAARMAEASNVPVSTVHRWIREARLRGFLPPGKRGKAG